MASNTERSKKWRKKIRNDPSKYEEYKKRDREKKKKKYAERKVKVCNKVSPLYVPQAEANSQSEKLKERWNRCRTIPHTHAIHSASKVNDCTISVARNSQFLYNVPTRENVLIIDQDQTETVMAPSSSIVLTSALMSNTVE